MAASLLHWGLAARPSLSSADFYRVRFGNIQQTVSASGQLEPATQVALGFSVAGRVATVAVTPGQRVRAGQVLATLDATARQASARAAAAGLAEAEANRAALLAPPLPAVVAPAAAAVTRARLQAAGARQTLTGDLQALALNPAAFEPVLAAQTALAKARAALAAAVAQAEAFRLRWKLAEVGVAASPLVALRTSLAAQQTALAADRQRLAADQATLAAAARSLATAKARQAQDTALEGGLAAAWPADQAHYLAVLQAYENGSGYPQNPAAAALTEAAATAQAAQAAYQLLQTEASQVAADQAALLKAEAAVEQDRSALAQAHAAVTATQEALAGQAADGPLAVLQARWAFRAAEATVRQLQATLAGAKQSLAAAEAVYHDTLPARLQLDQDRASLAADRAAVVQAQAALAAVVAPPSAPTLAAADAAVRRARALAQAAADQAGADVLRAPVAGQIAAVAITPGTAVFAGASVMVLDAASGQALEAQLWVPESQLAGLSPGDPVTLSVPAFPSRSLHGTVLSVAPTPQVVADVALYQVTTSVAGELRGLLPGMTANAVIVTHTVSHVLAIPQAALLRRGRQTGVLVAAPGRSASAGLPPGLAWQPLALGPAGNGWVAVTRGLSPGRAVLVTLPPGLKPRNLGPNLHRALPPRVVTHPPLLRGRR